MRAEMGRSGVAAIAPLPSIVISGAKKRFSPRPLGKPEDTFHKLLNRIEWHDVKKAGKYPVFDLPAEALLLSCSFVVESDWKSRGRSTMTIQAGGYLQTVSTKKQLTAGSIIKYPLPPTAFLGSPGTIEIVTNGAAWTSGIGVLIVQYAILPV